MKNISGANPNDPSFFLERYAHIFTAEIAHGDVVEIMPVIVIGMVLSYLVGCIPFGLIFTKLFHCDDASTIDSTHLVATNGCWTKNKKVKALVLLCNFLKGFLPCICIMLGLLPSQYDGEFYEIGIILAQVLAMSAGFLIIIGDMFPVWWKIKRGRGVATSFGVLLAISYTLGVIFIICWVVVFLLSRIALLASLSAFAAVSFASLILCFFSVLALGNNQTLSYVLDGINLPLLNRYYPAPYSYSLVSSYHYAKGFVLLTNAGIAAGVCIVTSLIVYTHQDNTIDLITKNNNNGKTHDPS